MNCIELKKRMAPALSTGNRRSSIGSQWRQVQALVSTHHEFAILIPAQSAIECINSMNVIRFAKRIQERTSDTRRRHY